MKRAAAALFLGFFVLSSAGAGAAFAGNRQPKASMEKAAKKACATGDFQKGVDILADLFVATDDPNYVYNQGRCYQQNNRWEQAISRFMEFLRKARNLSDNDRADTEQQIAECEASLGKTAQVSPPPAAPPQPAPTPLAEPSTSVVQTTTPATVDKPAQQPSADGRGRGWRVTGIILACVGVAAVGTGVGLALKANSLSTSDYSRQREDERASLKTWGFVSYGVGAAAIAAGVAFYVVGWARAGSSNVAFVPVVPVVVQDGASVLLRGRF